MTTALAATLVFKNMHCSGVAANATLEEYNTATVVDGYKVIKETQNIMTGSSRTGHGGNGHEYVALFSPLMDPTGSMEELFILPGPNPLGESFN